MTLTQALAEARRLAGLSTVDMATTDLTYFVQRAEVDIAIEMLETNPNLAMLRDSVTVPASAATFALTPANLASLGAGREVYKVGLHAEKDNLADTDHIRVSATEHLLDLSGPGYAKERGQDTASVRRILVEGSCLRFYPVDTSAFALLIAYTRVPVAQSTPASAILADFTPAVAHIADDLVCLQAASDALAAWGRDNSWQEGRLKEAMTRRMSRLSRLQQQESGAMIGGKWPNS